MTSKEAVRRLGSLGACQDGINFVRRFKTFEEAWSKCTRGGRMEWLLTHCADMLWQKREREDVTAAIDDACDHIWRQRFESPRLGADLARCFVTPAEAAELLRRATK